MFDDMYRGLSTRAGGKEPAPRGSDLVRDEPRSGRDEHQEDHRGASPKLKWLVLVENVETRRRSSGRLLRVRRSGDRKDSERR